MENNSVSNASELNKPHHIRSNKENSKPTDIYIKKPRTCTLLDVSDFYLQLCACISNELIFFRATSKIGKQLPIISNVIQMWNHEKNVVHLLWI